MDIFSILLLLATIWSTLLTSITDGAALNDYILDYQPLHFDQKHIHKKHNRVQRSIEPYLRFTLKAYNRTFNVQLEPSQSIFTDNHELVVGSEPPRKVDTSFIYDGYLEDDPASSVHLSVVDGSISGHIIVPGHTTYHIEPAKHYIKDPNIHSIIYQESRMNLDPYRHKRAASGICGSDDVYANLKDRWRPVEDMQHKYKRDVQHENNYYNKYTEEANMKHSRQKRQFVDNRSTCFMSLRADNLLYKHIYNKYNKDAARAKDDILSLFASHIKALNDIYSTTKFGNYINVRFQLQRSTIMTECGTAYDTRYCSDTLDVSNFLDLTSTENHDSFCLVHTFTYRDFDGGTLGLAWVASPDSRNSGVCGKNGPVRDSKNNVSNRNLNTGIVTFINFKQDVPPRVSQLTFAHEVGHNFGSPHDQSGPCAPYGTSDPTASSGNYIMFPSATQGNLPNNAKFSSCSISSITKVLDTIEPKGRRVNCFQTSNNAFCGNGIVEMNETCDCGYSELCQDTCCFPQTDPPSAKACTLNTTKCSPSQGPCCSKSCEFVNVGTPCASATDCKMPSSCIKDNATCPTPDHQPDLTLCNSYTKTCSKGECIGSICSIIKWTECFVTQAEGVSIEAMCYISCKKNETSECVSSYDTTKVESYPEFKSLLVDISNKKKTSTLGLKRPAGSPCNDFKGFCDGFSKCRKVDAEGPFKQLTDLIFSPVTLKNIRTWIEEYWWAVLLMSVGVVVFMGVFIKVFSYNTPNKDPKKKTVRPQAVPHRGAQVGAQRQGQPPRKAQPKPAADNRSTVYTTDLPMYTKPSSSSRGAHEYDSPTDYSASHAYDNNAFQGPSNHKGHQQYDRIAAAPRKY